jgi:hypothetical protein
LLVASGDNEGRLLLLFLPLKSPLALKARNRGTVRGERMLMKDLVKFQYAQMSALILT